MSHISKSIFKIWYCIVLIAFLDYLEMVLHIYSTSTLISSQSEAYKRVASGNSEDKDIDCRGRTLWSELVWRVLLLFLVMAVEYHKGEEHLSLPSIKCYNHGNAHHLFDHWGKMQLSLEVSCQAIPRIVKRMAKRKALDWAYEKNPSIL